VAPSTVEQRPPAAPAIRGSEPPEGLTRQLIRRYPAPAVAIALLALSTLIVLWADTRPGFDPYGWLVWGHQTLAGNLNTNAAPSWKPLPYLFTAPYASFGRYELWLWMITSTAVSLSGVIFAGRIAYRLTAAGPERRYAGLAAAAFAGLALLGIEDYWHYILSFQSDPMIVSLCLGAVDCHLSGRPRAAFALGGLAALGRPEVWPFLALYTIWTWRAMPAMRSLLAGGWLVIAALWFGIPALTSRSPFVAGTNALGSGRALHSDKVFGTIDRFLAMHRAPLELAALVSVALAAWRRDRVVLALAGGVVAWVALEIAFSLHGWPGLQRYMFPAGGVMVVLAGVLVGRLLSDGSLRLPARIGGALVALLCLSLAPAAISRARAEHKDLRAQRARTKQIGKLAGTISRLGGPARLRRCGEPLTRLEYQTILAWDLHVNVAAVGFKYTRAIRRGRPIVLYTPVSTGGWRVQALHQRLASCRTLPR